MKYFIFLVMIVALILISCEKSEDIIEPVYPRKNNDVLQSEKQKEDVVVSKEGYLVFKNMDVYSKILKQLDFMTDEEFNQWEKSLGFQSSLT